MFDKHNIKKSNTLKRLIYAKQSAVSSGLIDPDNKASLGQKSLLIWSCPFCADTFDYLVVK